MRDVIVIGAGGGGPVVAKELAARGLDVLLLEAGARNADPDSEWTDLENDANGFTQAMTRTSSGHSGNTSFKPYPKSAAGRRIIPIPAWLRPTLLAHLDQHSPGEHGLIFANQVGKPLRRTLFRRRVWRPALS